MSKYFDKLNSINESLTKEMNSKGLELAKEGNEDEDTVNVPIEELTDDQKKEMLIDRGVDKKVVDGLGSDELNGAIKSGDDEIQTEESGKYVIKMDDPDLDLHGFIEMRGSNKLTDEEGGAAMFASIDDANKEIEELCNKFGYDPATLFVEPEHYNDEVNDDDEEAWVSLDPINSSDDTVAVTKD